VYTHCHRIQSKLLKNV